MRTNPVSVRLSVAAWAVAVAAGVVESCLAVAALLDGGGLHGGDWVGIAVRVVVYIAAGLLVAALARGRRWARLALTVLLSVLGLASLVVPAVLAVAAGQTVAEALSDGGRLGGAFLVVRVTHIGCVVLATVAMYLPSAGRRFALAAAGGPEPGCDRYRPPAR